MGICTLMEILILQVGFCNMKKETYKPKEVNKKKLLLFLNKIKRNEFQRSAGNIESRRDNRW